MPKTYCLFANKTKSMRKSEKQGKQTDFFKKSYMSALLHSTGKLLMTQIPEKRKYYYQKERNVFYN